MRGLLKYIVIGLGASLCSMSATTTNLTIKLAGSGPVSRKVVTFQCDAGGVELGLPAEPFQVVYLNGVGNSLAILPIHGRSLIFVTVLSGSGARYASDRYIWWDAGDRGVHLYSDSLDGKKETACRKVDAARSPTGR
jgi:membrane-bound inhibitor of C-type lysozyme